LLVVIAEGRRKRKYEPRRREGHEGRGKREEGRGKNEIIAH
jgi:hypothetical protein